MATNANSSLSQVATTTGAETTLVTADANFRNDVVGLVISAPAAGTVTIRNVTGGAAVLTIVFTAAGVQVVPLAVPAQGGGINQNWTIASTATGTTTAAAQYVKGV